MQRSVAKIIKNIYESFSMVLTRVPCILVTIMFVLNSTSQWPYLIIAIFADIILNMFFISWELYSHYIKVKDFHKKRLAQSELIIDDTISEFNEIREKFDPFYFMNQKKLGVDLSVIVTQYSGDKDIVEPTTIPYGHGNTIIGMQNGYDSNDIVSLSRLAHEFGHSIHFFLRQEQFITVASSLIYSICYFYFVFALAPRWTDIIFIIPLILIVVKRAPTYYTLIESNANLLALQLIEVTKGIDMMHKVAKNLLMVSINRIRKENDNYLQKQNSITSKFRSYLHIYIENNCIRSVSPYITEDVRESLIKKSQKLSKSIKDNPFNETKFKNRKLRTEHTIRKSLERFCTRETSFDSVASSSNFADIILLFIQVVWLYVCIFSTDIYLNLQMPLLIILEIIACLIIYIFQIWTTKKDTNLMLEIKVSLVRSLRQCSQMN